ARAAGVPRGGDAASVVRPMGVIAALTYSAAKSRHITAREGRRDLRMPYLAIALMSFAAGTLALQWQAQLHSLARCVVVAAVLASLAVVASAHVIARSLPVFAVGFLRTILLAAAAGALGWAIATWRAELRLADALPEAWE